MGSLNHEGISISAAAAMLGISEKVAVAVVFRELGLKQGSDPSVVVVRPHTVRRLRGYIATQPKLITAKPRPILAREIQSNAPPPKFAHADGSREAIAWRKRNMELRKERMQGSPAAELAKALANQSKKPAGKVAKAKSKGTRAKKPKPSDDASSTESTVGRMCSLCNRVVTVGLVTKNVLPHEDDSRATCAGSGMAFATTLEPTPKTPKPMPRGKSQAKVAPKVLTRQQGAKVVKSAKAAKKKVTARKAAIRHSKNAGSSFGRARYEDEFGGKNSVRAYSGGSPGLGKRR